MHFSAYFTLLHTHEPNVLSSQWLSFLSILLYAKFLIGRLLAFEAPVTRRQGCTQVETTRPAKYNLDS